jgi:hypothetical protein
METSRLPAAEEPRGRPPVEVCGALTFSPPGLCVAWSLGCESCGAFGRWGLGEISRSCRHALEGNGGT